MVHLVFGKTSAGFDVTPSTTLRDLRVFASTAFRLSLPRVELRGEAVGGGKAPVFAGDAVRAVDALAGAAATPAALGALKIFVKDLGPQFSYRGVFVVEYGAPIAIVLAALLRPAAIFGAGSQPLNVLSALTAAGARAAVGSREWNAFVQALAITLWVGHFAKREFETCVPQRRRALREPPRCAARAVLRRAASPRRCVLPR